MRRSRRFPPRAGSEAGSASARARPGRDSVVCRRRPVPAVKQRRFAAFAPGRRSCRASAAGDFAPWRLMAGQRPRSPNASDLIVDVARIGVARIGNSAAPTAPRRVPFRPSRPRRKSAKLMRGSTSAATGRPLTVRAMRAAASRVVGRDRDVDPTAGRGSARRSYRLPRSSRCSACLRTAAARSRSSADISPGSASSLRWGSSALTRPPASRSSSISPRTAYVATG